METPSAIIPDEDGVGEEGGWGGVGGGQGDTADKKSVDNEN